MDENVCDLVCDLAKIVFIGKSFIKGLMQFYCVNLGERTPADWPVLG